MKLFISLIFFIFFATLFSYAQKNELLDKDTLPSNFRFQQKRHGIDFFAGINIMEYRDDNNNAIATMYAPAISLGYCYFPVDRFELAFDFTYTYSFNKPTYDHQMLEYKLSSGYFFLGNRRFFLSPGIDFYAQNWIFKIHKDYPNWAYFGDTVPDKVNSHTIFYFGPRLNVGLNIWNNMSIHAGIGYSWLVGGYKGNLPYMPYFFNLKFSYYFPKK